MPRKEDVYFCCCSLSLWSCWAGSSNSIPKQKAAADSEPVWDPSHLTMICVLLLTLFAVVSADRLPRSCDTCDPSKCAPLPGEGCSSGTLLDACGCCELCASGAGEPCGGRGASAKRCASGLECVKSDKDKKSKSGVCVCKSNYPVCGTDGANYNSGCELKEASVKAVKDKKPEIKIRNKGKCAQGEMPQHICDLAVNTLITWISKMFRLGLNNAD